MTKKDFELIAKVLREATPEDDGDIPYQRWAALVIDFARELKGTNHLFNFQRFVDACYGRK